MKRNALNLSKNEDMWERVRAVSQKGLESGSLNPIETACQIVPDKEINFVVRIISSLAQKPAGLKKDRSRGGKNPFLPYEENLYVGDLSDTHVCLLNKFNVMPNHILLVTKNFKHQETVLDETDFSALSAVISDKRSLGFYNSGEAAGASQPHRHLQVIPFPLCKEIEETPLNPLIENLLRSKEYAEIPQFFFKHKVVKLHAEQNSSAALASTAYEEYKKIIREFRLIKGDGVSAHPHNLIVTSEWMIIVPRSLEFVEGISINSLGFAGGLLVKNQQELEILKKTGPLNLLRKAGIQKKMLMVNYY